MEQFSTQAVNTDIIYYGLRRGSGGIIKDFICFSSTKLKSYNDTVLIVKETTEYSTAVQQVKLLDKTIFPPEVKILKEPVAQKPDPKLIINKPTPSLIGLVGHHSDSFGSHVCISITEIQNKLGLLFLTSNNLWNKFSRKLTKEEAAFINWASKKTTYLAPVIRHESDIIWTDLYLPDYRVKDLEIEFFSDHLLHEVKYL